MKRISVPVLLIQNSLDTLKKQASERDCAMEKLASVEAELRVAQSIMEMVSGGLIDPSDSLTKFAEFKDKPELIELTKHAAQLGYTNSGAGFGDLVRDDNRTEDVDPESRFFSRLETL
jgi:phage shock protein A